MKLVFATNNLNKLSELQDLLPANIELLGLKDIGCNQELPETQNTLEGNAMQKAEFVFEHFGYNCFADDTGLEVGALKNEPGVYSARYAGNNVSYQDNVNKLLIELDGVPRENRKAKFRTVVTYIDKNDELWTEGHIDGIISENIIGDGGFGYDPIFFVPHIGKTFAELSSAEKNKISHRGIALQKLRKILINVLK